MENIIASMAARDFCAIQGDKARQRRATLGSVARLPPVAAISRAEEACDTKFETKHRAIREEKGTAKQPVRRQAKFR